MIIAIDDNTPKFFIELNDEDDGSQVIINSVKTNVVELNSTATIVVSGPLPITFIAATNIIAYKLITTSSTGQAVYADANNLTHVHSVLGIATNAAQPGSSIEVKQTGIISNSGWNWIPKQFLYLGFNGDIITSQVGLICVSIGYAINSTEISLNINQGILRS